MKKAYDPYHTLSYGYYVCTECDSHFFGGGKALHKSTCRQKGYDSCVYYYGDKELK